MEKNKLTTKLFSLSCENEKGILSRIIETINRPGFDIETLSQSRTADASIVLITLEVAIPGTMIDHMVHRLRRIVGVFDVLISFGDPLSSAIYRVDLLKGNLPLKNILSKYAVSLAKPIFNELVISQLGSRSEIQKLYNELAGKQLVSFSNIPLGLSQPEHLEES